MTIQGENILLIESINVKFAYKRGVARHLLHVARSNGVKPHMTSTRACSAITKCTIKIGSAMCHNAS